MSWRHPQIGRIGPMIKNLQPYKVWKHFYDANEHWERLCEADVSALREEAESILGIRRENYRELPGDSPHKIYNRFKTHAQRAHDDHYGCIYMAQMSDPKTQWSEMDKRHRHHALTPNSIRIVVALEDPQSCVLTAFRPVPKVCDVNKKEETIDMTEETIDIQARWLFSQQVFMNTHRLNEQTLRTLSGYTTAPKSVESLWHLTLAIGQAMVLPDPTVRQAAGQAQVILDQVPEHTVSRLINALDWGGCLEQMTNALEMESLEEMETALFQAQSLLMVAQVLGVQAHAVDFLEDARMTIAWVPASWSILADHAASRREHFDGDNQYLFDLWSFVEQTIWAATLQQQAPSIRPSARLVTSLIEAHARPAWIQRLSHWLGSVSDQLKESLDQWATLELKPASPMMGSDGADDSIEVRVHLKQYPSHYKAFVVDQSSPEGIDVTANLASDGFVWVLDDAEDEAVLLFFAASERIVGDGLDQVYQEASERDDVTLVSAYIAPDRPDHGSSI